MYKNVMVALIILMWITSTVPAADTDDSAILLNTRSLWRWRVTWGTDVVRLKSGELIPVHPDSPTETVSKKVNGKKKRVSQLRKHETHMAWPLPSSNWKATDFNDSSWALLRGPFCHGPAGSGKRGYRSIPLMCLRGRFRVTDPESTGKLELSMRFQGGVIVYLNGKEVGRAYMPKGAVELTAPAEDYPENMFFDSKGLLWERAHAKKGGWREFEAKLAKGEVWTGPPEPDNPKAAEVMVKRLRRLNITIPPSALRTGTNIFAVEVHRAPALEGFFSKGSNKHAPGAHARKYCWWSRIGLQHLTLKTAKPGGAQPNAGHIGPPEGVQVWTHPVYQQVRADDYTEPGEPLYPIRICSPRNGVHSGQIVIRSGSELKGLKVTASDLNGPGRIPAAAVRIRYGLPDGRSYRDAPPVFDGLEEVPVSEVPVYSWSRNREGSAALQPVWVTVHVPKDALPGAYRGTVTVGFKGGKPVQVPLELEVIDWDMPDSNKLWAFIGLIQSPESVALQYDVDLWSDEHWEKLDRSLKVLGEVGAKSIWVTAQRRTHFGNEHAMITFKKRGRRLMPDMSVARKYVKMAAKHMGSVPVVSLYCWRCPWATGHYGSHKPKDHKVLISTVDPDTNELMEVEGPDWGTQESVDLWRPVFREMRRILKENNIPEHSLMIGTAGDYFPTNAACRSLAEASGGAKWIIHAHIIRTGFGSGGKHATGYSADGWGGHCRIFDPELGAGHYSAARGFGWKNNIGFIRVKGRGFARNTTGQRLTVEMLVTSPVSHKHKAEKKDYGMHGQGRLGADFWPVIQDKRGRKYPLVGRYTETAWGQMSLRCCGCNILSPGKEGAISTVRLEMLRENVQEIEARIFIEKALADPDSRAKLGDELAQRAQELLDERKRLANRSLRYREMLASGIAEHSAGLYRITAEVFDKLNSKGEK